MKAAVYREFGGRIRVENIPIPKCPVDGVVVQVGACGVCRSDWREYVLMRNFHRLFIISCQLIIITINGAHLYLTNRRVEGAR